MRDEAYEDYTEAEFQQDLREFKREVRELRWRVWLRNRFPWLLLVGIAAVIVRMMLSQ